MPEMYVALHNLGCKVNAYEMEKIAEKLISAGFSIVSFDEKADYYIVNTCSVTNIADRKSRQMLHRAKKLNPDAAVIAIGCYVDTHGEEELYADNIDIAVPNSGKDNIVDIIKVYGESHRKKESDSVREEGPHAELRTDGEKHHRSGEGIYSRKFLKVQDGCNMFCSYCIIPYARGRIKSRTIEDVISEVGVSVKEGYSEFVLTGIHISSFGKDRPGDNEDLISLIEAVDRVPGVKRLRLGSMEPRIITDEFVERLKAVGSICPHFHLSLQSGSDSVLKRMNRHYSAAEYRDSVERLRRAFTDPAITTDVIVGFPGESPEEFEETHEFLKAVSFYETHIFPYSRRKGTPADKMPGQLSRREKHDRLEVLMELNKKNKESFEDLYVGRNVEVLFEEENEGYTKEYIRVKCMEGGMDPGTVCEGVITGRSPEGILIFKP